MDTRQHLRSVRPEQYPVDALKQETWTGMTVNSAWNAYGWAMSESGGRATRYVDPVRTAESYSFYHKLHHECVCVRGLLPWASESLFFFLTSHNPCFFVLFVERYLTSIMGPAILRANVAGRKSDLRSLSLSFRCCRGTFCVNLRRRGAGVSLLVFCIQMIHSSFFHYHSGWHISALSIISKGHLP